MTSTLGNPFLPLQPNSFKKGDILDVHAGQLFSRRRAMPFDFYKLAWCDSTAGHAYDPDTVGVTMRDTKIIESPY